MTRASKSGDPKKFLCMACQRPCWRLGRPRRCPNCQTQIKRSQPTPDGTILMFGQEENGGG